MNKTQKQVLKDLYGVNSFAELLDQSNFDFKTFAKKTIGSVTAKAEQFNNYMANKVDKAKAIVKKVAADIEKVGSIAILRPFAYSMKKQLAAKGYHNTGTLENTARLFYHKVIKQSNFDRGTNANGENFGTLSNNNTSSLDPVTISLIISACVSFFKMIKDKEAKGEALSKAEQDILNQIKKGEAALINEAKDEASFQIGDFITDNIALIGGGIVLVLVLVFTMKK